ncbi:kinase/pyrophosphorylase [Nitrosomonas sp. HPC101]|uniref:pyruvate, water dikinase regulatory protein n=1 Tax=Nitrosomonas sp. HPC101 TaxID=1658667 RepID=UPI001371788C|nr:pyruvate, water dikinase regulatory protein [Nitrosomonas sp. HPC101]MXS85256.1 kinase/pyrophosphorylase [Nitrosomonas sp. HPC101]
MLQRSVFFLSDRTGITAETLGHSLLTQFDGIEWKRHYASFLDSAAKVQEIIDRINAVAQQEGQPPLIFSTLLDPAILASVRQADCYLLDFFESCLGILETALQQSPVRVPGRSHILGQDTSYFRRIAAIQYALNSDDGSNSRILADADVILVGVSRSGKTPVCVYLALQYGVLAANYPFTTEDMGAVRLPALLQPLREKLFGLTLNASRLQAVRAERYPGSHYASFIECQRELEWQNELYRQFGVPSIDTTGISIEEISASIINRMRLERRLYGT